ncbi:DMT family transporter [Candidatus Woesearchaeota archaeon]|nr:DMT family transporter [Candidatus Woesearchaeota archaeon]
MKKGLLFVFLTALISGLAIFLNKFAVSGINSSVFTFSKNLIVAIFLLSIIILFKKHSELKQLTRKQWSALALVGLVGGSVPFLLFFKGLQMTASIAGAFIHKTMFIYIAVLAVIFLKEKLSKSIFVAAALLLAGNYFLLGINSFILDAGAILILCATLFWAVESVISKKLLTSLSGNTVAFGRMFFGSVFILAFLFATGQAALITAVKGSQLLWIIITSVLLLGYVTTWYNGLKQVKVSVAASVLLLGSPITTLLNFAYGSSITLQQWIGITLLAAGAFVALYFSQIRVRLPFPQHSRSEQ